MGGVGGVSVLGAGGGGQQQQQQKFTQTRHSVDRPVKKSPTKRIELRYSR